MPEDGWDFGYLNYGEQKTMARYQYCVTCGEKTGRCSEDAMMVAGDGPYCETCYIQHCNDRRCTVCNGEGTVEMLRGKDGLEDYLKGVPTGIHRTCEYCDGEGYK